jgi:hypothetical protein
VTEGKPGQIESAVLGIASVLPFSWPKEWISAYFRPETAEGKSLKDGIKSLAVTGLVLGLAIGLMAAIIYGMMVESMAEIRANIKAKGGYYEEETMPQESPNNFNPVLIIAVFGILGAISSILGNLITSAIFYIFAKLLGGKGNYSKQTAMLAYVSSGMMLLLFPFYVLLALPIIGGLVGGLLNVAISVIGLYGLYSTYRAIKHVHQLSTMRAAAVVLSPIVLIVAIIVFLMFFAIVGLFGRG